MNSFKTDGYKVSFTNLPMLTAHLCDQIQNGGMSKYEASKTIAKAMLHLT